MAESTNVDSGRAEMERILHNVAGKISTDWKKLARRLEVPHCLIENIDADFQNMEEKAYQALMKWFQMYGHTDHNKTKHVLIKALRIESKLIADEICSRHHIKVPPAECTKLYEKPRVIRSANLLRNRESKEMQQKAITDENKIVVRNEPILLGSIESLGENMTAMMNTADSAALLLRRPRHECMNESERSTGNTSTGNTSTGNTSTGNTSTGNTRSWKTSQMREKRAQSEILNRTKIPAEDTIQRSLTSPADLMRNQQPNITINSTYNINGTVTIVNQTIMPEQDNNNEEGRKKCEHRHWDEHV